MSYFPCDIPFMSDEELKENGIKIPKNGITQKELIDACNDMSFMDCMNRCRYYGKECKSYIKKYDDVPHMDNKAHPERYTDDVIEEGDTE